MILWGDLVTFWTTIFGEVFAFEVEAVVGSRRTKEFSAAMFCTLAMCNAGTAPGDIISGDKGGGPVESCLVLRTGESVEDRVTAEASESSSGASDTTLEMAKGKLWGSSSA